MDFYFDLNMNTFGFNYFILAKQLFILLFILGSSFLFSQNNSSYTYHDSILRLLSKSKSSKISNIERLVFAEKAKELSIEIENDSLVNASVRQIALVYWDLENYNLYKKTSQEYLKLSTKLEDSFHIGKANNYLGHFYKKASVSDSSYFYFNQAEKIFRALNDKKELATQLIYIASIQRDEKDFVGSEVTTFEAVELSREINNKAILANAYNNLGIIYNQLGQFDDAIKYYNRRIELLKEINPRSVKSGGAYHNLANVYKNNKQYDKALNYFSRILQSEELKSEDPEFYALAMDNYAHTKFLMGDTDELPKLYLDALKICDSIGKYYRAIELNIHLSQYYNSIHKMDSARYFGHQAKDLAKNFHNDDYLKALLNLSEIEVDSLSTKYYKEYIHLNDSIINNERNVRNKFARIRYETKEIEEKNEQISKERMYLLILSIGLLLTIFLTYSVISQRAKNKELKLNQLQQEANEEIYNLMLTQQDKIKEGRVQEKKRISEELHDGILGRLFGTRLSLDSLNLSNTESAAESRSTYIEELKSIEEEIRRISHDLNSDFVSGSGYFEMIENLVEKQTRAYGLSFDLEEDDNINWRTASNKTKINLYRIVQESLQNIYKHANAKHVDIKFNLVGKNIVLEITDDGSGFDTDKSRKGIGLKNIESRAKELNGKMTVESQKNKGTTIKVQVPE